MEKNNLRTCKYSGKTKERKTETIPNDWLIVALEAKSANKNDVIVSEIRNKEGGEKE